MTVKWEGQKFLNEMDRKKVIFLHDAGNAMVNQMVDLMHVQTGLLRNSIIYRLANGIGSKFKSLQGPKEGRSKPDIDEEVSNPNVPNSVRVGSNVVYAGAFEKHTGRFSEAFDLIISSQTLVQIAAKIFKVR